MHPDAATQTPARPPRTSPRTSAPAPPSTSPWTSPWTSRWTRRQPWLHDLVLAARRTHAGVVRRGRPDRAGRSGRASSTATSGAPPAPARAWTAASRPRSPGTARTATATRFVAVPRHLGDHGPDPTVRVVRRRDVEPGLVRESYTVSSAASEPVRATVSLHRSPPTWPRWTAIKAGDASRHRAPPPAIGGHVLTWDHRAAACGAAPARGAHHRRGRPCPRDLGVVVQPGQTVTRELLLDRRRPRRPPSPRRPARRAGAEPRVEQRRPAPGPVLDRAASTTCGSCGSPARPGRPEQVFLGAGVPVVPHPVRPGQPLGRPDDAAARHRPGRRHPAACSPAGRAPGSTPRPARRPARSCTSCAGTSSPSATTDGACAACPRPTTAPSTRPCSGLTCCTTPGGGGCPPTRSSRCCPHLEAALALARRARRRRRRRPPRVRRHHRPRPGQPGLEGLRRRGPLPATARWPPRPIALAEVQGYAYEAATRTAPTCSTRSAGPAPTAGASTPTGCPAVPGQRSGSRTPAGRSRRSRSTGTSARSTR